MCPTTDSNSQTPTFWNRLKEESSFSLRYEHIWIDNHTSSLPHNIYGWKTCLKHAYQVMFTFHGRLITPHIFWARICMNIPNFVFVSPYFTIMQLIFYSRTSMARTSSGPWTFVRDMGSSSHWGLIITPVQEANSDNLGTSFRFSTQWLYVECTH